MKISNLVTSACLAVLACVCRAGPATASTGSLAGAWRGGVQFTTGAFAEIKDLEFMYTFNEGGTMNESSNYDGAPPVPPAYGVWRKVGDRKYEARYEYFWTNAPANWEEIKNGGGWSPGGRGVLTQKILLSVDGASFKSTITFQLFDKQGKAVGAASEANATGKRMRF